MELASICNAMHPSKQLLDIRIKNPSLTIKAFC